MEQNIEKKPHLPPLWARNASSLKRKLLFIFVALLLLAGLAFAGLLRWERNNTGDDITFCTQDAMLCPDGSYVGRTGPNCEFAPCPGEIN